jgi:predicted Zn-dependent protease
MKNSRKISPHGARRPVLAALLTLAWTLAAAPLSQGADRTQLKPGWNLFTPEQDIELGREASKKVEQQLRMLNDPRVDKYLNELGRKLAAHAPGYKYPYQFKCVNDEAINAFALPGGFIYINRGAIEAADDEAQLAGVMAHEISHVALRHGTNQATKSFAWQVPLSVFGAVFGGNTAGGLLAQLGAEFTVNSLLLKYSRGDESQADVLGTQILYDSGYDPRAMAQFFEKIQAESKGRQTLQFFSDHPDPGNRMQRVDAEVDKLGGPEPNYTRDSDEFHSIRIYLMKLPPPPKSPPAKQ